MKRIFYKVKWMVFNNLDEASSKCSKGDCVKLFVGDGTIPLSSRKEEHATIQWVKNILEDFGYELREADGKHYAYDKLYPETELQNIN